MKKHNVVTVIGELEQTIKKLNYYPLYQALKIPAWNLHKKRKIKGVVKDTLVWMWGERLLAQDRKNAETTYYYAQIHPDFKKSRKHFSNQKWRKKCRQSYNQNRDGTPNYAPLANKIITKIGATSDTDDTEKKVAQYLTKAHKHFVDIIRDADLTLAERMFRDQAAAKLKLRGLERH